MKSINQQKLELISKKHLADKNSDELYDPMRDLNYQFLLKKFQNGSQQNEKFYQFSQTAFVPLQLQGLKVSSDKILPSKKFIKVAQRQKRYQPVPLGVIKILEQEYQGPQQIVYKYADLSVQDEAALHYRVSKNGKSAQNRANFRKNFNQKIKTIEQLQQKKHQYNVYSFLDEPLSYIRSKI